MLKQIYLIHHTHYDIGFTDLPDEVERQQMISLDEAIRLAESDPEYRWTIESGSLFRNYLENRPAEMRERLLRLLRSGRMELAAFDMQILTETASFGEFLENFERTVRLGKQFGFPVECGILDDIGGAAGELPRIMNEAGVRYLIAGCGAFQTELPWADLPWLFYLQSRSGGKILVWNLGNDRNESSSESKYPYPVYGMGSHFLGYRSYQEFFGYPDLGVKASYPGDTPERKLSSTEVFSILMKRLEREKYPYGEILLQYGGDNRNPAPEMCRLVRKLNESGKFPPVRFTTPTEFFRDMEAKYGGEIPVVSGVLADPWNLRINAIPSVLKNFRKAQRIYEAGKLRGLRDDEITENLLLVSDHTLGLNIWGWQKLYNANGKNLCASCFDRCRDSWKSKAYYAETALRRAVKLLRKDAAARPQLEDSGIAVRNRCPHEIGGTAELYLGSYAKKLLSLKDSDGNEVPRQLIGQNRWLLHVKSVPALGSIRLTPVFSPEYGDRFIPVKKSVPEEIATKFFRMKFSPAGELLRVSHPDGTVLLQGKDAGCGEILCETIRDSAEAGENCGLKPCVDRSASGMSGGHAEITSDGELFTEILQRGTFPRGRAERVVRLWKNLPRIDFSYRLDLPENPEKTCWYAVFPFTGRNNRFLFDQNAGIVSQKDLLPGSMLDLFYCSRYAALEEENFTAVLCCPDSPIVEFGGMHTAKWRKKLPAAPENNHLYGLLYNNICNTDAPPWQRILDTFSYSLFFDEGKFKAEFAHNCWNSIVSLESEVGFEAPEPGFCGIPAGIRVHTDSSGGLHLENPSGESREYDFDLGGEHFAGILRPFELKRI